MNTTPAELTQWLTCAEQGLKRSLTRQIETLFANLRAQVGATRPATGTVDQSTQVEPVDIEVAHWQSGQSAQQCLTPASEGQLDLVIGLSQECDPVLGQSKFCAIPH